MERAASVTAGELAGDILSNSPPPPAAAINPPADAAPAIISPPPPDNPPALVQLGKDRDGVLFDAERHLPEKDDQRRWKKKPGAARKRGRPSKNNSAENPATNPANPSENPAPGAAAAAPSSSYVAPDPAAPATPAAPDKFDLAADMYCRAFYAVADSTFTAGGEWMPDDDAEHEGLAKSMAAYMRAKGMQDLPPGPAMLLAVGTYAAKRIQRPKTQTRWRLMVSWCKARWATWRAGRRIEAIAAPTDSAAPA